MKDAMKHILVALAMAVISHACVNDDYPEDSEQPEGMYGPSVTLTMSMQMPSTSQGRSRALLADGVPAEQVHDLRVVVVSLPMTSSGAPVADEEARVEANELLSGGVSFDGFGRRDFLFKNILADRKKKIYILANCEEGNSYLNIRTATGTPIDLADDASYLPTTDSEGQVPAPAIEEGIFTAPSGEYGASYVYEDGQKGASFADYRVPITAVHEIDVPTISEIKKHAGISPQLIFNVPEPLYVVRAVNKITVTMENNTGTEDNEKIEPGEVRLKSFKLTKVGKGEKSYLLAHLDEADELFKTQKTWSANPLTALTGSTSLNKQWMQWLFEESRRNYPTAAYQWLTSYDLPDGEYQSGKDGEKYYEISREYSETESVWTQSKKQGSAGNSLPTEWSTPAYYFPETKYLPNGGDKDQAYEFACVFERKDASGKTVTFTYGPKELPELKSLFRNTHVKVNFSVTDNLVLDLTVIVLPWVDAPEEAWHYTRVVTVQDNGYIKWSPTEGRPALKDDTENARLIIPTDNTPAIGTFRIDGPRQDEWYAYLIPLTGETDAFMFVDAEGNELTEDPHGLIDGETDGVVRIRQRRQYTTEQNTAMLQIMVRTADNRFLEADVVNGTPTYYTVIQNRNIY